MQKPSLSRLMIALTVLSAIPVFALAPFGMTVFLSAICGVLVALLPQAYFAWKAFSHQGALFARRIVKNFYVGETVKILMTAMGFALVFKFVQPLNVPVFIGIFIVSQCLFWLTPFLLQTDKKQAFVSADRLSGKRRGTGYGK